MRIVIVDRTKPLLVLFVVVHLLVDLAMPSLPGAFRFNFDESVAAVRAPAPPLEELARGVQVDFLRESSDAPRLEIKAPVQPQRRVYASGLMVLLPRRDPSSDRASQRLAEDH
jgi:hypothetical protein